MSFITCVNVSEIKNLIDNKTFEEVKNIMEDANIRVRELKNAESDNLYLLISNNTTTPLEVACNGIILEKETNEIVCMCQSKLLPFQENPREQVEKLVYDKMRLEYCEDATRVSLYNYNGVWYTATTKCIDAKYSYWSSYKTFDDMFWEIFDNTFINVLDPDYTYTFLLIHRENRIVVKHQYNNLIYINKIHNKTQEEDYTNLFYKEGPKRTIRRPKSIDSNTIHYPLDDYYLPNKRGVIVKFLINNSWVSYQYDFKEYQKIKEIRGNVPLIRMRYLELLSTPDSLIELEKYYPEYQVLFTSIRYQMNNLYKEIHQTYFYSHVKHTIQINEDHPFFRTLKQLHYLYKTNNTPITFEQVQLKVNSLDKNVLKKFLNWV